MNINKIKLQYLHNKQFSKMHVDFDPLNVEWSKFTIGPSEDDEFYRQTGGYAIFRGMPYQRGNGLGSIFRRLFRYLLPIGKEIGSAIGRQGLETGSKVLSNVLEGKDLKQSLIDEGKVGLKSLLDKASSGLERQQQTGQGVFDFKKYGKNGKKTAIPKLGKHIHKLASVMGPSNFIPSTKNKKRRLPSKPKTKNPPKRLRIDSLGTY